MSPCEAPFRGQSGSKWAILIGIDQYPGIRTDALKGCVHDVRETRELLCSSYGYQSDHILQLTSPGRPEISETKFAQYLTDSSPSYDNIVDSFRAIHKMGRRGDVAYIHFSGYVLSDVPSILPHEHRTHNALDSAIAPVGVLQDGKYLHDLELALLLHELVAAGIGVTIIVDGRFTLYRGEFKLPPSRSSVFVLEELKSLPYDRSTELGAYTWLRCPDPGLPYALLWRVSSWEHNDQVSQEWSGVLTSWLHKFLKEHGLYVKFRFLWQKLQMEPVRLTVWQPFMAGQDHLIAAGDLSELFPMSDRHRLPWSPTFPAMLRREGDRPILLVDGGAAHGIEDGTRFIAISQSSPNSSFPGPNQHVHGVFRTANVHGLSSSANVLAKTTPQATVTTPISAYLVPGEWTGDASDKNLDQGLASHPLSLGTEGSATPLFSEQPLSLSMQADLYRQILLVKSSPSKPSQHANVIVVGGYRQGSLSKTPIYPAFDRNGHLNLLSGDFVTLYIHSRRREKLFVNILSFDSAFGITQVYPQRDSDPSSLGSANQDEKGYTELKLCLRIGFPVEVETNSRLSKVSEILRVFVTKRPTSFEFLELPRIKADNFLRRFPDPAGISTNSSLLPHSEETLTNDIMNMKFFKNETDEDQMTEYAWFFFDAQVVVHRTEESLAQVY